jgi:hypothetical protein
MTGYLSWSRTAKRKSTVQRKASDMSDQIDEQNETLSDEQRQQLAAQERMARLWARVQADEANKAEADRKWKSLGSLTDAELKEFVRKQTGVAI